MPGRWIRAWFVDRAPIVYIESSNCLGCLSPKAWPSTMLEAKPQLEDSVRLNQSVVQVWCLHTSNMSASFRRSAGLTVFAAVLHSPDLVGHDV